MANHKAHVSRLLHLRRASWWLVLVLTAVGLIAYALAGRLIIAALYNSESYWSAAILSGRATTPIEAYYRAADERVFGATLWLVTGSAALWVALRQPLGLFISGVSLVFSSFLLFWFFETFPGLIKAFHLDAVSGYYAYKTNYLPDPELGFRERPFNRALIHGFAGANYSPLFGIDVKPMTIEWLMDQDGFRNSGVVDAAEVVILGDSYLEYGSNQADTFGDRLEAKLPGLRVRNLGKSGYAPFQYLAVLKRYGLKYKPRHAVMAIYEGNDIAETRDYLLWKSRRSDEAPGYLLRFATDSLLRRYRAVLAATVADVKKTLHDSRKLFLHRIAQARGYAHSIHPDVAHLDLRGKSHRKLFIDRFPEATSAEMLATEEFAVLRSIFGAFRDLCAAHGITPIVLYIPAPAQIYAKYSTNASGANWLRRLEAQIAFGNDTENAVSTLVREAGVDFVSLTPVFGQAAEKGKLVYYPLDEHWNAEGRDIAARFLAQTLRSKYLDGALKKAR